MPSISQLEYLLAVDREKHFGKAAKACYVSQPSLSAQILKVEELLQVKIFDRNKKPIETTANGKIVIEQAKEIIGQHKKLHSICQETQGTVSGEFRLAIIPTLSPYLLPLFLKNFSDTYPKVKLIIDEEKTETIIELLNDNHIDGALVVTPLKEKTLTEKVLFTESFSLYLNTNETLLKKTSINEKELEAKKTWLLEDGHCFRNQVINYCSKLNKESQLNNIFFEGGNLETLRQLVKKNWGYTLLPQLFTLNLSEREQKKHLRPFSGPKPSREVSLVYSKKQWKKNILSALEKSVKASLPTEIKKPSSKKQKVLSIS